MREERIAILERSSSVGPLPYVIHDLGKELYTYSVSIVRNVNPLLCRGALLIQRGRIVRFEILNIVKR